jgi:hypothetical protein
MNLAQDTDTWRAVLNTQMGDWGLYRGIWVAVELVASKEELCCIRLVPWFVYLFVCWLVSSLVISYNHRYSRWVTKHCLKKRKKTGFSKPSTFRRRNIKRMATENYQVSGLIN